MEVIVGKTAGYCGGVLNAITKAEKYVSENDNVYCLGEIAHNKEVINKLTSKGLVFVDSLDEVEDGANVIIRAHGIPKFVYEEANRRNIKLYDLTCPKVLKIHEQAKEYANDNFFIVLIGHKNHPEVNGTISFSGTNSIVVETIDDVSECLDKFRDSGLKKLVVLAHTTFSLDLFDKLVKLIGDGLSSDIQYIVNNTICFSTESRQKEAKELAKEVDAMIVIGGSNSSNTIKLYEISKEICQNTYLIETVKDLKDDFTKYNKVGIMAGASTPRESIDEVLEYLES